MLRGSILCGQRQIAPLCCKMLGACVLLLSALSLLRHVHVPPGLPEPALTLVGGNDGWTRPWAWGVFTYHHYHSTAWEALLCVRGSADVQFGGPSGPVLQPAKGDLVLVPPGVAHKQLADRDGFTLLGAYPSHDGCRTPSADTVRGAPTAAQARNIAACATPVLDPRWGGSPPWDGGLGRLLGAREECRA